MASEKPFQTKTTEENKSVVEDRLNPTAEMHILIGGPYTAHNGDEHRYGHTALRFKTATLDITYDFGRYEKVRGMFGESGDGILRVWTVFHPYITGENSLKRTTTGFVYLIFDYQVAAARVHFDRLIKAGKELVAKRTNSMRSFKLSTDYHALGPNCTTISVDGAEKAVQKIAQGSEKYNRPDDVLNFKEELALSAHGGSQRLFLPANLHQFLTAGSFVKISRNDIYGSKI